MPVSADPSVGPDGYLEGEVDWDDLVRARNAYHLQRMLLFRPNYDPAPILRAALASGTAREAIEELAEVADHRTELVRSLVTDLFPHTLGLHPVCGMARHTINLLEASELEPLVRPLVDAFLADPHRDWEE